MQKSNYVICISVIVSISILFFFFNQEANAVSRDEIQALEKTIKDRKTDLAEYELEVKKAKDSVANMERRVRNAEKVEKTLKDVYDNNRNDSTRNAWEKASENTRDERRILSDEKERYKDIQTSRDSIKRIILDLEIKLTNYKRVFELESHVVDSGIKTIGIQLSKTCIRMIQANMSGCPDYNEPVLQQLDNSDRSFSGDFKIQEDGVYRRDKPPIKNHYLIYPDDRYTIILDPDGYTASKIKMIYIEINFDQYLLNSDYDKVNNTRTIHVDRYVYQCKEATLNAEKYFEQLADTIFYMRNGCKSEYTKFNSIIEIQDTKIEHDISTSRKYIHDKFIQEAKVKYKENRIGKD